MRLRAVRLRERIVSSTKIRVKRQSCDLYNSSELLYLNRNQTDFEEGSKLFGITTQYIDTIWVIDQIMLKLQNLLTTSKYAFVLQMLITAVIFISISALLFFGSLDYNGTDPLFLCCGIQPIAVITSIALKKRNLAISTGLLIAVILWDIGFPTFLLLRSAYLCQTQSICPPS